MSTLAVKLATRAIAVSFDETACSEKMTREITPSKLEAA